MEYNINHQNIFPNFLLL